MLPFWSVPLLSEIQQALETGQSRGNVAATKAWRQGSEPGYGDSCQVKQQFGLPISMLAGTGYMVAFSLGGTERERVTVEVTRYERAPTGDYHDDNWLDVTVTVCAGAFDGTFSASFQAAEFVGFRNALRTLYDTLRGEATFTTLEEQLFLKLTGNGRGQITLEGQAFDQPGVGNRLEFRLEIDQTHVATAIRDLETLIETYPVRTR